jgi:hypothetical protein
MSQQTWVELVSSSQAGTAIASSVTETIIFPNITVPANYMTVNRWLRLRAYGQYGTTATPTLIFSVRWGGVAGTVIAKSGTMTTSSGTGGGASMTAMWSAWFDIQCLTTGSSGSFMTNGEGMLYTSTAPTAGTVTNYGMPFVIASGSTGGTTPVSVTVDTTADTALAFTATWGTSNAANSLKGLQYSMLSLD